MTDHPFSDDQELVQRMLEGDAEAFDAFCELYPGLYRFAARQLGNDPDLVMEVTQNTVLKAIESLDRYRGESTLFTWLCGICRFEVIGQYKRKKRAARHVEVDALNETGTVEALHASPEDDPAETAERNETARQVHATLDGLPERYAAILEWKYHEGLSVKEIAQRLGLGVKAAESLLTRARNAFRDSFPTLGEPVP